MDGIQIFLYSFLLIVGVPFIGMVFFAIIELLHFAMDAMGKVADEWVGDKKNPENSGKEALSLYALCYCYGLIVCGLFFWVMSLGE